MDSYLHIKLPASFLTGLFALNVRELPHEEDTVTYKGSWIFPIISRISSFRALLYIHGCPKLNVFPNASLGSSFRFSRTFSYIFLPNDWFSFPQKSPTQVRKKEDDEKKDDDMRNGSVAIGLNQKPFGRMGRRTLEGTSMSREGLPND